jgi:hypothetical protein
MPRPLALLLNRIGRRGAFLLFLGALDAVYAFSLFKPAPGISRTATVRWVESAAPLWVWGLLWATGGALCIIYAFRRQDRIGYGAAVLLKVLWGTLYLLGWIFGGLDRGYLSAVIWLGLAVLTATVSTWPEGPPFSVRDRRTRGGG